MDSKELTTWKWFDLDKLPKNIFSASQKTIDCYKEGKFFIE